MPSDDEAPPLREPRGYTAHEQEHERDPADDADRYAEVASMERRSAWVVAGIGVTVEPRVDARVSPELITVALGYMVELEHEPAQVDLWVRMSVLEAQLLYASLEEALHRLAMELEPEPEAQW